MNARWRSRRTLGLTIGPAAAAIILTVVVPILLWPFLSNEQSATPRPSPTAAAASPATTVAVPSPAPSTSVVCTAERGPLPSFLADDPCPSALLAVEIAVAPVRLPVERIVVEPGPFYCDVIWPGVQSPAVCFGTLVRPGQFMHAWVSFVGSPKVAAVMLGLDLPADEGPSATRPPWSATLVAVQVPPDGWVMP